MKTRRTYTQTLRAESAAATRRRIIEATIAAFTQLPAVTLADVARRAGVSVQTVLRHFNNRDALVAAAMSALAEERAAPRGDPQRAISVLYDQYERRGDANIRLLGKEDADPHIKRLMDQGRAVHRDWVREVFASDLDAQAPPARGALLDLLVLATDVYSWKLLRRDRRLSRRTAEARVRLLVERILR